MKKFIVLGTVLGLIFAINPVLAKPNMVPANVLAGPVAPGVIVPEHVDEVGPGYFQSENQLTLLLERQ
jgi:hypothetical protein